MSRPVRSITLERLRDRIRRIEAPARPGVLPFGVAAIDGALPGGGLALGGLHEIAGTGGDEEDGAAAAGFAAGILARLGRAEGGGPVLWCLKQPDLHGPGLPAHGLDPARLVLVAARRDDEILWTVEEGLRAGPEAGLAAVVAEIGRLPMVAGRRLQLAAERSGLIALLLRRWRSGAEAAAERERPSAAVTRWRIAALPSSPQFKKPPLSPLEGEGGHREMAEHAPLTLPSPPAGGRGFVGRPRWRVELLRCRGGVPGSWDVEVADAAGHVSLSAGLADRPAAPRRLRPEPLVRRAG